jgi:hypothetical protein
MLETEKKGFKSVAQFSLEEFKLKVFYDPTTQVIALIFNSLQRKGINNPDAQTVIYLKKENLKRFVFLFKGFSKVLTGLLEKIEKEEEEKREDS